ncbi:HupE/UreJ family protein [Solimonas sp. K1W22B-7]|uniref:HupE/UreJ family protein n=1 Tax=Solimonas sp. K1W22B-7 TaxID=2303331 RepID=UPI0013C4F16C|nr:HupE/UreJ family protein [Solimonas sp. K1W22B-7]
MLLCSGSASAHSRSVSYSSWTISGEDVSMQLRLPMSVLNPAGWDPRDTQAPAQIAALTGRYFQLDAGGQPCTLARSEGHRGDSEMLLQATWHCQQQPQTLHAAFLLDRVPGHLHLLQLSNGGQLSGPWAMGSGKQALDLSPAAAAAPPEFGRYLLLGAEHILIGWDHLAFLMIVLLGAGSIGPLAWRITGFTLGHSVTLLLASRGWVRPESSMVEAFIALTIVCAAAERLLRGSAGAARQAGLIALSLGLLGWLAGVLPLALALAAVLITAGTASSEDPRLDATRTALFGLFHGLGFAAVLGELNRASTVPLLPLLGFNAGVELGQLLFVIPVWWLAARWPPLRHRLVAAALLALGTCWFLQRLG